MPKLENKNVTTGIWYLGEMNAAGVRSVQYLQPKRPRYVQTRKGKKDVVFYYWCASTWAKRKGFFVTSEALGNNLQIAFNKAHKLNHFLDNWRHKKNAEKLNKNISGLDKQNRSSKPIKRQLSN